MGVTLLCHIKGKTDTEVFRNYVLRKVSGHKSEAGKIISR